MAKGEKYELIKEPGSDLYQIKALVDIPGVTYKGEMGGFVEGEGNLSHEGHCWIYGNAKVTGKARVYENAQVSSAARVYGDARVLGYAKVSGASVVREKARISGEAKVGDHAHVSGNAHVSGDAQVMDYSDVSGDARVSGCAKLSGEVKVLGTARIERQSHLLVIADVGSERGVLSAYPTGLGTYVSRGCFRGTLAEFEAAVLETHGTVSRYALEYAAIIALIRARMEIVING